MKNKCFKYELTVFLLALIALSMIGLSIKNFIRYRKDAVSAGEIIASRNAPKVLTIVKAVVCKPEEIAYIIKGAFSSIPMDIRVKKKKNNIYLAEMLSNSLSYSAITNGFTNLSKFFSIHIDSMCIGYECGKNRVAMTFRLGAKLNKENGHTGGENGR